MKGTDAAPIPETKAECLALALEWGHKRSHWNEIVSMVERNEQAFPLAAQADAAEVSRLSALYPMLAAEEPESIEWRIFDAESGEVTGYPVNESAAYFEFKREREQFGDRAKLELHRRPVGAWEVAA